MKLRLQEHLPSIDVALNVLMNEASADVQLNDQCFLADGSQLSIVIPDWEAGLQPATNT